MSEKYLPIKIFEKRKDMMIEVLRAEEIVMKVVGYFMEKN